MATITTVGAGDWGTAGTWDLSRKPAADDTVVVDHAVALDEIGYCSNITLNALLTMSYDLVITDASGGYVKIGTAGGITNALATAVKAIRSASSTPTYRWYFEIADVTTADTRTIQMDYIECRGNKWSLGNDTHKIYFNDGSASGATMLPPTPLVRTPNLDEHEILMRDYGRVYHRSNNAGSMAVSGSMAYSECDYLDLQNMIDSGQRISLVTNWVHLPFCRVERHSFRPRGGGLFLDYSISLREDR